MSAISPLSAVCLLLAGATATAAPPTLEDRFSPRSYLSADERFLVDATLDHLAVRAAADTDPADIALLVEEAAAKVVQSGAAWPRITEAVLARDHGLFVVRFAEDLPRPTLAAIASVVASAPSVMAVYPGLRRMSGRAFSDERLVVTAAPGQLDDVSAKVLGLTGGRVLRRSLVPNTVVVEVGAPFAYDAVEASAALAGTDGLVSAEPELYREYALTSFDDPMLSQQWHLSRAEGDTVPGLGQIFAPAAWDVTTGDPSVVVAVFDSGTDLGHEDLAENIVGGFDAVSGDDDASPECSRSQDGGGYAPSCPDNAPFRESHGTSVSGTIAARGNNATGVVGVCPDCSLYPVRLLGDGFGSGLTTAEAFVRAVDEGADVINNSWGPGASIYFPLSSAERDAFEYARTVGRDGLGTVVVFAAGNDTSDVALDAYAAWHHNIAVSASSNLDDFALYSNYGFQIDVAAPSQGGTFDEDSYGIVTADVTGGDGYSEDNYTTGFGGTSASSPVTAGVAGLLLSANPQLTAEQVRLLMTSTADKILADKIDWLQAIGQDLGEIFAYDEVGHSIGFGFGRVNAGAAVAAASSPMLLGGACDAAGCELCDAATNRCLTTCEAQGDCPDGATCSAGRCTLPRPSYTAIGEPCSASCTGCVPALDSQFQPTEICTDTCESDSACPSGFDCRRPQDGGEALCVPGSRSAGDPASFFNCFNDIIGVSLIVSGEQDDLCSDVCLNGDDSCPWGFHCGAATCECTAGSNRGCWQYSCDEAPSQAASDFPVPLCFADEGYGVGCDEDLDCPKGDYCKESACLLDDREGCSICGTCSSHDECGPGGACLGLQSSDVGTCSKQCASHADCPGNSACVEYDDGRRVRNICGSNEPAAEGFCKAGWQCEVACRDDVPCGEGLMCDEGECVPETVVHDHDGGPTDGPHVVTGSGCGCAQSTPTDVAGLGLVLFGLLAVRRRRRL